jgi:hypothetical protein
VKRLNLPPTETEIKRDALKAGYREFFEDWLLKVPFQWFVTIHYTHKVSLEIFERKIKKWIRKIEDLYFKPTLGAIGLLVEGQNGPHAHFLLYGENLKDGRFDSNGNPILEETQADIHKAKNVWVKLNGEWTEPSHPCPSEPDFVSIPKERSIDIQTVYNIDVAEYFASEKNLHIWRDQPSETFSHYHEFLKKTAGKIKRNASETEPSAPSAFSEQFGEVLREILSQRK